MILYSLEAKCSAENYCKVFHDNDDEPFKENIIKINDSINIVDV